MNTVRGLTCVILILCVVEIVNSDLYTFFRQLSADFDRGWQNFKTMVRRPARERKYGRLGKLFAKTSTTTTTKPNTTTTVTSRITTTLGKQQKISIPVIIMPRTASFDEWGHMKVRPESLIKAFQGFQIKPLNYIRFALLSTSTARPASIPAWRRPRTTRSQSESWPYLRSSLEDEEYEELEDEDSTDSSMYSNMIMTAPDNLQAAVDDNENFGVLMFLR